MGIINILDKQTANLIAAGEVVERPSSAIKEMLENCADAGAKNVTVEIKNGGTTYIRITDDGKGMLREDVPKAVMRHATSKIRDGRDLEAIGTYGFRGEALAAISAVSRVRILTSSKEETSGTLYECDFGEQKTLEDAGCPFGTTITVENIFENVPARRKFLKKDSTEALNVLTVCEKFALSRPDIALTFISDNALKLQTPGNGDLKSTIYSAMGRDFAAKLLEVDYTYSGVTIHGYIGKPEFCRPNRNMQNFFVNNRYIRSRTMLAAVEEGFRGFCPTGKFPACVLFCNIDLRLVDVNVHPAKLEIKFSNERKIFDAVYFAVKNSLATGVTFACFELGESDNTADNVTATKETSLQNNITAKETENVISENNSGNIKNSFESQDNKENDTSVFHKPLSDSKIFQNSNGAVYIPSFDETKAGVSKGVEISQISNEVFGEYTDAETNAADNSNPLQNKEISDNQSLTSDSGEKSKSGDLKIKLTELKSLPEEADKEPIQKVLKHVLPVDTQKVLKQEVQGEISTEIKKNHPLYIGEVFDTYIIVQNKNSMYIIDKHAAHERIIYERLKNPEYTHSSQYLLEGINVFLTPKEAESARENKSYFENIGFEYDDFGTDSFIIRAIPSPLSKTDVKDVFTFLAGRLSEGNSKSAGEIFDRALFTAACRAAIKGGDKHTDIDNKMIIDEVFNNEAVLYCPHGRPVICEFSHEKLNKMFDRP